MPGQPRITVIPDILEEHLEEVAFLWMQRLQAVRSHEYVANELDELDDRLEAHMQGLLLGGDQALPLLKERLMGDDYLEVFAAAYTLLRMGTPAASELLLATVQQAGEVEVLDAIVQAMCHGSIGHLLDPLRQVTRNPSSLNAAMAMLVLAYHGEGDNDAPVETWLSSDDPTLRRIGWKMVAILGR